MVIFYFQDFLMNRQFKTEKFAKSSERNWFEVDLYIYIFYIIVNLDQINRSSVNKSNTKLN